MSYIHNAGSEAMELMLAEVRLRGGGGTEEILCSRMDYDRIHGALVHPFLIPSTETWVLFIKETPDGVVTDYPKNGEITDGMGFFHYMGKENCGIYHFRNNDWKDLSRQNWETCKESNQGTKYARRYRKALEQLRIAA